MCWMVNSLLDDVPEVLRVGAHEIDPFRTSSEQRGHLCRAVRVFPGSIGADLLHLRRCQASFLGEELEAVPRVGQV